MTAETRGFDALLNRWTIAAAWRPAASELPVRDYVLSWWRSSLDGVELYERQAPLAQKAALVQAAADGDDENEEADDAPSSQTNEGDTRAADVTRLVNGGVERRSTILPSHSVSALLTDGLEPSAVYVIEVRRLRFGARRILAP